MTTLEDRGLGFVAHWDGRNDNYSVGPLLEAIKRDPNWWRDRIKPRPKPRPPVPKPTPTPTPAPTGAVAWKQDAQVLDQGKEGACVGFAFSNEMSSDPHMHTVSNQYAFDLYRSAQAIDRKAGRNYQSGATILAGAQASVATGRIKEYRWARGVEQLRDTVRLVGPAVLGIPWYSGMYRTGEDGLVNVSGSVVGGHAIMVFGYDPKHPKFGECFLWENSWGFAYGVKGVGYVPIKTMSNLLGSSNAEICVPTDVAL